MWKKKNTILIVFLMIFCAGCVKAQKLTQIVEIGELKGTVTPAVQATITLCQDETEIQQIISDPASGKFSIPELTPGTYSIIVDALNYQRMRQEITVASDQSNEIAIVLVPNPSANPETLPPTIPNPTTPEHYAELITNVAIEKDSLDQGEKVNLTVTMTNPKNYPINIGFSSGSWRPSFILTDKDNNVLWYSMHGLGAICLWRVGVINPGETWTWTETWNGRDNHGNIISPGAYVLKASGLDYYDITVSTGKEIYIRQADLSAFTGRIIIEFKDNITSAEARTILENQGLSNLSFSIFGILKSVYAIVPETEKTAIIQQLKQNSEIVDACPVSDRE